MTYSVAIRTLGTSHGTLRRELESIHKQTVQPERICIYIAEGYPIPDFKIGREEYFPVKKGMVSQRALQYDEISSDCILMLDDDVELAPDSAERLLKQMEESGADCMAADTFKNHEMGFKGKLRAAVTGLVFPRFNQKWAFKIHSNDSFSYINNPKKDYYPSMSAAGPCSLWKKDAFLNIHYEDEIWLDQLEFAYGDDGLFFYKLYVNGGRLFVSFNNGVKNLDAKSASKKYQEDPKKLYYRAYSNYLRWYRMHNNLLIGRKKIENNIIFSIKLTWVGMIHTMLSICSMSSGPLLYYLKGNLEAYRFCRTKEYKLIPCFKLQKLLY